MKKRFQGFVAGALSMLLLTGAFAFAKEAYETISVIYNNIKIEIDGEELVAKDANGQIVEPFIYNGTTYLPVRAIAEAFDKNVAWDEATYTVSLTSKSETSESGEEVSDNAAFKDVYAKSVAATSGLSNYGVDCTMDVDMVSMGESLKTTTSVSAETDGNIVYTATGVLINNETFGVIESYIDFANSMVYNGYNGQWIKTSFEEVFPVAPKLSDFTNVDVESYLKNMNVEEATIIEKTYNGIPCYEISGTVALDYTEALSELDMASLITSLETEDIPENFFEDLFKDMKPFSIVMGVDKETYMPLYMEIDMTEMLEDVMAKVMSIASDEDVGEFEISKYTVSCTYRDFGNISLELPEVTDSEN